MNVTAKEALVRELTQLLHERAGLDKRIAGTQRALKEITRTELEGGSKELPYLNGRISGHALQVLKERGATPRPELVEMLKRGGAGILNKNQMKEINKALDRCLEIGTIRETSSGLVLVHPTKPVKKSGLFGKKKA